MGQGPVSLAFGFAAVLWLLAMAPSGAPSPAHDSVAPESGPTRLLFGAALDPNRADAATLEVLPGIGPARAAAIVATRCERPFAAVSDLRRVPGIGPHTLRGIAPSLAVSGAPPLCASSRL